MKPLVHWVQTIVLLTLHVPVLGKSVIVKADISLLYEHCILLAQMSQPHLLSWLMKYLSTHAGLF